MSTALLFLAVLVVLFYLAGVVGTLGYLDQQLQRSGKWNTPRATVLRIVLPPLWPLLWVAGLGIVLYRWGSKQPPAPR